MPQYSRRPFGPSRQSLQTMLAARRVHGAIALAKKLQDDPDRVTRQREQLCIACFYFSRLAGQAFTDQPCACCGTVQTFSSTATDELCSRCALEHDLCKRCGGDIDMNERRKQWPTGPREEGPCPEA